MQQTESTFLYHEPCPACGSSDAMSRYSDGHGYCFSCQHWEPGEQGENPASPGPAKALGLVPVGEVKALSKRGISEETCRKWGYSQSQYQGRPCQVANYRDGAGKVVSQKLRFADKTFKVLGDKGQMGLYGQWLWRDGGKMVVVTEGEIDALTVSQLWGNKWPVVSIPNGAPNASKAIKKSLDWLERFDSVIFLFDQDEAGQKAVQDCIPLLSPGKAKVASIPLKDANEMLQAGKSDALLSAIWDAKAYRPDGILTASELVGELEKPVEWGLSYPWEAMTRMTYGIRTSEMIVLGAGTGMGKTEVFKEIATHLLLHHQQTVGFLFLEERPSHTLKCLMGKVAGQRFHIPDAGWTPEEFEQAKRQITETGRVYLYDSFGYTDYQVIKERIRYMVVSLGCRYLFLDHLTALTSGDLSNDERKLTDAIVTDLASLVRELDCCLFAITHLNTPEGTPHEEGGRVTLKHYRGSRAIAQWANFCWGIERNQQDEDTRTRHRSTLRCLKDRYSGQHVGETFYLYYQPETGKLFEQPPFNVDEREPEPVVGHDVGDF